MGAASIRGVRLECPSMPHKKPRLRVPLAYPRLVGKPGTSFTAAWVARDGYTSRRQRLGLADSRSRGQHPRSAWRALHDTDLMSGSPLS